MSDQRKTPTELDPAAARGEGASLAAASARALERRRLLLALVAMTGSVVVGGCRRTSAEGVRSFTTHVIKPCLDHGMGILAMKTLAFGRLLGKNLGWQRQDVKLTPIVPELVSLEQALNYVWSLPVSVLISGMENAKQVKQNAAIARNAGTLDDGTRLKLVAAVEGFSGRDVEFYKD
jgi:hypothetical protein